MKPFYFVFLILLIFSCEKLERTDDSVTTVADLCIHKDGFNVVLDGSTSQDFENFEWEIEGVNLDTLLNDSIIQQFTFVDTGQYVITLHVWHEVNQDTIVRDWLKETILIDTSKHDRPLITINDMQYGGINSVIELSDGSLAFTGLISQEKLSNNNDDIYWYLENSYPGGITRKIQGVSSNRDTDRFKIVSSEDCTNLFVVRYKQKIFGNTDTFCVSINKIDSRSGEVVDLVVFDKVVEYLDFFIKDKSLFIGLNRKLGTFESTYIYKIPTFDMKNNSIVFPKMKKDYGAFTHKNDTLVFFTHEEDSDEPIFYEWNQSIDSFDSPRTPNIPSLIDVYELHYSHEARFYWILARDNNNKMQIFQLDNRGDEIHNYESNLEIRSIYPTIDGGCIFVAAEKNLGSDFFRYGKIEPDSTNWVESVNTDVNPDDKYSGGYSCTELKGGGYVFAGIHSGMPILIKTDTKGKYEE